MKAILSTAAKVLFTLIFLFAVYNVLLLPTKTSADMPSGITTVFTIVFENHDWSAINGSSSAPYINSLLSRSDAVYASNYHNIPTGASLHPSEPNYIWMEAGTNCFSDMTLTGVNCTSPSTGFDTSDGLPSATNSTSSTAHLVTQLTGAGKTWKSYQEDITGTNCPIASRANYTPRHDPFVYFQDVSGNPPSSTNSSCQSHIRPYTELATDLANSTLANYNYITPNLCHDMHSNSCVGSSDFIKQGDDWLSAQLPSLLNSDIYQSGNALVIIAFDEGGSGNNPIPFIMLSPKTKGDGYTNATQYTHSSYVKTMEEIFGIGTFVGHAADSGTVDLSDFFTPTGPTPTPSNTPTPTPTPPSGISYRSSTTANNGTGSSSLSIDKPSGTTAGDVMIAQIVLQNNPVATPSAPSGWTQIQTTQTFNSMKMVTFYHVAGTEGSSYSFTISPSTAAIGGITSYIGVDNTTPIDDSGGSYNSSTTTVTAPSVTTTAANDMLLFAVGLSGNGTIIPPSGFTEHYDFTNGNASNPKSAELADFSQSATGATGTEVGSSSITASNLAQLIALKAAPTPTAAPTNTPTPTPIPTYEISGLVYTDTNQNAAPDVDEDGYSGATVFLTGTSTVSTTTEADGSYSFNNLTAGTYKVRVDIPTGYTVTTVSRATLTVGPDVSQDFGLHSFTPVGYRDFSFAGTDVDAPSGQKPQSKLWFNDGLWWGSLYSVPDSGFTIQKFNTGTQAWTNTGTVIESRHTARLDSLWDGTKLYVVAAGITTTTTADNAKVYRFSYDSSSKTYSLDTGFPVILDTNGGMEAIVMAKDTAGTVWATYTRGNAVYITHTTTDDATWTTPYLLNQTGSGNLEADDISTIVSYGSKIGIMWSNQTDQKMYFASHNNSDSDTTWTETIAVSGTKMADDHMNLKADSSGNVYAITKTSRNDVSSDPNEPILLLSKMDTSGNWTNYTIGTLAEGDITRAIGVIDETNNRINIFYSSNTSGGLIYTKSSSLSSISFPTGANSGTSFIQTGTDININNSTSFKQNANSTTGILVVAGDDITKYYTHNYTSISTPTPTPTNTPTPTPTPAFQTITYVGSSTADNGTGTDTLSITKPSGTADGNVLVAQIVVQNNPTDTVTPPSGWTQIQSTQTASSTKMITYYHVASSDASSYAFSLSPITYAVGGVVAYSGVDTTNPVDASGGNYNASTTTVTAPSVTTTAGNDMLLFAIGVAGNGTVTPPSGFTERYDVVDAAPVNPKAAEFAELEQSATGATGDEIGSSSITAANLAQLIALKAAATPAPTNTPTPTPVVSYTIDGSVYVDTNLNGVQDTGETGYQGATVTISGGVNHTTDADGHFSFTSLSAGSYALTLTAPANYYIVTDPSVTKSVGPDTSANFGIAPYTTTTLNPTADAYVSSGSAASNFGTSPDLITDKEDATNPRKETYMKFDLSSLANYHVTNAKLRMYVTNGSGGTNSIKEVSDNSWTETGITFNNKPTPGATITTFVPGSTLNVYKEVDITSEVQSKIGDSMSLMIDTVSTDGFNFNSKDAASNKLELVITNYPPNTPTPTPTDTPTPTPIPTYTVSGNVYIDRNENSAPDTGEANVIGATVTLTGGAHADTDSSGNYSVTGVTAGTYDATLTVPSGYHAETANPVSVTVGPNATANFAILQDPTTVSFTPTADTYVASDSATSNFGTVDKLQIDTSPDTVAYLKYDLSSLNGKYVHAATLRIHTMIDTFAGSPGPQTVQPVSDTSWGETTMTYNNRPTVSSTVLGTLSGTTNIDTQYDIPLTQSQIMAGLGGSYAMAVVPGNSDAMRFFSREDTTTTNKPTLIIQYTD